MDGSSRDFKMLYQQEFDMEKHFQVVDGVMALRKIGWSAGRISREICLDEKEVKSILLSQE